MRPSTPHLPSPCATWLLSHAPPPLRTMFSRVCSSAAALGSSRWCCRVADGVRHGGSAISKNHTHRRAAATAARALHTRTRALHTRTTPQGTGMAPGHPQRFRWSPARGGEHVHAVGSSARARGAAQGGVGHGHRRRAISTATTPVASSCHGVEVSSTHTAAVELYDTAVSEVRATGERGVVVRC